MAETSPANPCEILDWDTAFWGFRIARLRGNRLSEKQMDAVDLWCRRHEISCLYFLARADDPATARLAENAGFRLVDLRVTLYRDAVEPPLRINPRPGEGVTIRPSRPEDVPTLKAIARRSHTGTRFYVDPAFPRHLCAALYETWIEVSCQGYADVVLVADVDGPAGYVSCHLEGEQRRGRIGLVGVAAEAQQRGVGRALVLGALAWFAARGATQVSVVTQGHNEAAQRLYQGCGFVTKSVELWYHKWYLSPKVDDE